MSKKPYTLVGVNGNAYSLMGYTMNAMRDAGYSKDEIDEVLENAKSGDYYNLIAVCSDACDKVNEKLGLSYDDEDEEDEEDWYDEDEEN